jgi:hypothetical protein
MAEQDKNLSGDEKRLIADGFAATAADLESHKAALLRLAENQTAEHAKVTEMAEEIRRLKTWTGLPEKNDLRGPAPGTLYTTVGVLRDLLLRVWAHLGLPEGDIVPKTKGGVN